MNEDEAVSKMRSLEVSINTALRYSNAGKKFGDLFLLFLLMVVVSLLTIFLIYMYDYAVIFPVLGALPILPGGYVSGGIPVFFVVAIFFFFGYRMLNKPFREPLLSSWEKDLKLGTVGILKVIESEDWENTLIELKRAKQAFVVMSLMSFLIYWGIAFVLIYFAASIIISLPFGLTVNLYLVASISVLLVIGLGDKSIKKTYRELWYMDSLVTELRWFYLEFQGSGF